MGVVVTVLSLLVALMKGVCSKTWGVTLPQSVVGLSHSCVTVPCHFQVPGDLEENLLNCSASGVWRRGNLDGPVVLDSRNPARNIIQGEIIGDLTKKNCTTVLHSFSEEDNDVYFFRLDCPNPIKYNFRDGVRISSQPAPDPPIMPRVGDIPEGSRVTLRCWAPAPCLVRPPALSWFPQDGSRVELTEMLQSEAGDGQWVMMSSATFIISADHHNHSVTCSVSVPQTTGGSTAWPSASRRLSVLYAPRFTTATINVSGPVPEGQTVTFSCSSDSNPPVSRYTWYRAHGTLSKLGEGKTLVLQVGRGDAGMYLCDAQSSRGSHRSRPVFLDVRTSQGKQEASVIPSVICGAMFVLCILTAALTLYKIQSLSRRLKQIELKSEKTYTDLRNVSVSPDYDQLQFRQPDTAAPEPSDYENSIGPRVGFKNRTKPS